MDIKALENMITNGRDSAILRLTIAGILSQQGEHGAALQHLESALQQDPVYTAAWKAKGKICLAAGDKDAARKAWQQGLIVAEQQGDKQAGKEMQVFLKRLDKEQSAKNS